MENLLEAFKELNILNEETFDISQEGIEKLQDFKEDDVMNGLELVIDPEAETEDELEDSYIGKAILDCVICHSKVYKDPKDVVINEEEDLVNISETCPYCQSDDGYKVIGQVTEFKREEPEEVKAEDEVKVEVEDKEDLEESKKSLDDIDADMDDKKEKEKAEDEKANDEKYSFAVVYKNKLGAERVDVYAPDWHTAARKLLSDPNVDSIADIHNDEKFNSPIKTSVLKSKDGSTHYVKEKAEDEKANDDARSDRDYQVKRNLKEEIENVSIETEDQVITVNTEDKEESKAEGEMIEPVDTETKTEFKSEDDNYEDVDIDEFDEEEFDELGEKYLRNVYENVKSFKTTGGRLRGNKLMLEGLITFKSGKQGKTNFVFEAQTISKTGKLKFIGENKQFAKGNKTFTLTGKMNGKKLISESLTYNYKSKDKAGNSKRLYGTVSRTR